MNPFSTFQRIIKSVVDELENLVDKQLRATVTFNHKFNANHTIRIGGVLNNLGYEFNYDDRDLDYQGDYVFDYSDPITLIASNGKYQFMARVCPMEISNQPKVDIEYRTATICI